MTPSEIVGMIGGAAGVLAALNSLRKVQIDDRTGVVADLRTLADELKAELTRVNDRSKQREAEMQAEVQALRVTLERTGRDCTTQIDALQTRVRELEARVVQQLEELERLRGARS